MKGLDFIKFQKSLYSNAFLYHNFILTLKQKQQVLLRVAPNNILWGYQFIPTFNQQFGEQNQVIKETETLTNSVDYNHGYRDNLKFE